jgi:DNA-directed RNA polymerase subunit RPC12/RpoP
MLYVCDNCGKHLRNRDYKLENPFYSIKYFCNKKCKREYIEKLQKAETFQTRIDSPYRNLTKIKDEKI